MAKQNRYAQSRGLTFKVNGCRIALPADAAEEAQDLRRVAVAIAQMAFDLSQAHPGREQEVCKAMTKTPACWEIFKALGKP